MNRVSCCHKSLLNGQSRLPHRKRPQDPYHRSRPPYRHTGAAAPEPLARRLHGHQPPGTWTAKSSPSATAGHPPVLISQTVERLLAKLDPAPHPPTRPSPRPRHDPAATKAPTQSRQRTPRPGQRLIRLGCRPTRPSWHANPSRRHLGNRHRQLQLKTTPAIGGVR